MKDKKMQRITIKQTLIMITYTVLLIFAFIHISEIFQMLKRILDLMKPFIYAFGIAYIFHLPTTYIKNKLPDDVKNKNKLAGLLSIILIVSMLIFLGWIVIPTLIDSIADLANALPKYLVDAQKYLEQLMIRYDISKDMIEQLNQYSNEIQQNVLNVLTTMIPKLIDITKNVTSSVANIFLAIVIAVYLTFSKDKLREQTKMILYAFTNQKVYDYILSVGNLSNKTFANFISGQLLESIIIGVLCYIGCIIFNFPYAPIVSVIIGMTNIIPYFGPFFGTGISAVLILISGQPVQAFIFIIFGIVLQQFESNLIYPRVVGNSVGLSGLWVLFAITVGGGLFGIPGMILGLPTFAVIYVLFKNEVKRRIDLKEVKTEEVKE